MNQTIVYYEIENIAIDNVSRYNNYIVPSCGVPTFRMSLFPPKPFVVCDQPEPVTVFSYHFIFQMRRPCLWYDASGRFRLLFLLPFVLFVFFVSSRTKYSSRLLPPSAASFSLCQVYAPIVWCPPDAHSNAPKN